MTDVPMLDLGFQHREVADEVAAGWEQVLAATSFIQGPAVREFEAAFADYCGVGHVVGVANGTDALVLALRAGGIGAGDEVILPANTFVATAEAVEMVGATCVLVDVDEDFLIDPAAVRAAVTDRTRAVIAVHLYGQTADVDAVRAAVGDGVLVVEDAAQAQGATSDGRRAGSLGDIAGTSFYPGKNLGAYGDGGAVLTDSADLAERVRAFGNHGGIRKYEHLVVGTNSRLDSLQAVVLSAKLRRLDGWNAERRRLAARYTASLAGLDGVVTPATGAGNEHVFHQYVVRVPERDAVLAAMAADGIGVGIHYPAPVHLLPAFAHLGSAAGAFPVAERQAGEILSLPIYPGLRDDRQDAVVESLTRCLNP